MSERYDPAVVEDFSDEEIEAIANILDGATDRKHGGDVFAAIDGADERQEAQARSLLDTLGRLRIEQHEQEADQQ